MLSSNFEKNEDREVITTESFEEFTTFKNNHVSIPITGVHSGVFHADEVLKF